jgi:hypothetical protein
MAADVVVAVNDNGLDLRVDALQYPANLRSELTSGLTTRFLARISLREGAAVLSRRNAEIAIRYDLWDQLYLVETSLEGKVRSRSNLDTVQLTAFLGALEFSDAIASAPLPADRELTVSIELLLNPIGREKLGMLRKWVAENNTPQAGGDSVNSGNSELFNRVFEQYADGSQFATTWRVVVGSRPFRLDVLRRERR